MPDEPVTAELAEKIQRDYVCAVCWQHLIIHNGKGVITIECSKYGHEHSGYITKSYADRAHSDSLGELAEAKYHLGPILGFEPKRTETEILKDLGF